MPTAPEAPIAPQISIGDRIHGIESRIEEIEGISGMNGASKSGTKAKERQSQQEETGDTQEEQVQSSQQSQSRQSTPQTQQRQPSSKNVTTPETMARDAVANGSGALTKRTTRRGDDEESQGDGGSTSQPKNQTTVVIPPNSALNDNGQTDFERGRAVLNEFKRLDQEEAAKQSSGDINSSTSTPGLFAPYNDSNSHGAAYWLFTLVAVGVLAFVFVKQFLVNKDSSSGTPPLTKSMLDIPDISQPSPAVRQSALNQYKQSKPAPPPKSTTPIKPPKPTAPIKPPPIVKPFAPAISSHNFGLPNRAGLLTSSE